LKKETKQLEFRGGKERKKPAEIKKGERIWTFDRITSWGDAQTWR